MLFLPLNVGKNPASRYDQTCLFGFVSNLIEPLMLRIVFSMMLFLLCTFALADNSRHTVNTIPNTVGDFVDFDSGLSETTDLVFTLSAQRSPVAPFYVLESRALTPVARAYSKRLFGNTSIRAPPLDL